MFTSMLVTIAAAAGLFSIRHLVADMLHFANRCLDRRGILKAWSHKHNRDDMLAAAQAMSTIMAQSAHGAPEIPVASVKATSTRYPAEEVTKGAQPACGDGVRVNTII